MSLFTFDPVGNLNNNRIQNELHTVSVINGADHNYLVPEFAPFYDESVVLVDETTGLSLKEDVDYFFAYNFVEASEKVGKPISGAIVFVDPNRTGNYRLNYQTLGGEYIDDTTRAIQDGIDALVNINNVNWEDLVNVPAVFPPTPHTHRLSSVVGLNDILAKFTELEAAIRSPDRHIMLEDIIDLNTGLLDPIEANFSDIAVSIQNLTANMSPQINETTVDPNTPILTAVAPGQWVQITPDITVTIAGTYYVLFGGNASAVDTSGASVATRFRFVVNGTRISKSYIAGTTVGLSEGDTVALEIRHESSLNADITVLDNENNSGLSIVRVGA